MNRTKLGISVAMLAAATYFVCLFGGYVISIIMIGYILIFEDDSWLKWSAVRAGTLMIVFSVVSAIVYFVPNVFTVLSKFLDIIGTYQQFQVITNFTSLFDSIITIIEKYFFLVLGIKAIKHTTITIPVVDDLIDKYM